MEQLNMLWANTGLQQMAWGQGLMLLVGMLLLYLAIVKKFEPLLLLPIGFGSILANIPGAGIAEGNGILHIFSDLAALISVSIFMASKITNTSPSLIF
jgi:oxaloacetate decarboxylase beta subunit